MHIVFAPRFFPGVLRVVAAQRWRLSRCVCAAWLMGLASTASQAQGEAAQVQQWQRKLEASFESIEGRWRIAKQRGIGMLALPAYRTLEEIKAAEYELEEYRAFDIADITLMNDLGSELAAILRVPAPPGFKDEPMLNIASLRPYIETHVPPFGLKYPSVEGDGAAFVTHKLLLDEWLRRKRSRDEELIRTLQAVFDSGALYQSVFHLGRAAVRLPVQVPLQSYGVATLHVKWDNNAGMDSSPKYLVVALLQHDRLVMSYVPVITNLPAVPSCSMSAKRLAAKRRYTEAQNAFMACYDKAVVGRPELKQASQQAQALLDRVHSTLVSR